MAIGVDKAVVGRMTVSGHKFEILLDPDKALDFKKGVKVDMRDAMAYPVIYKDASTTEAASTDDLQHAFGTTDPLKIAERIITKGEVQLTTEQRKKMTEQKRTQVASIITMKGINPQTNTPHPQARIEGAMDQAGVMIDPFADAESQVDKAVAAIKTILPIKFEKVLMQVKVPAVHSGKVFPVLKSTGVIKNEQWLGDGSLQADIELLAGVQEDFLHKIANATKGEYESKILKREDA